MSVVSAYTVGENGTEVSSVMDRDAAVRRIQRGLGFRRDRAVDIILSLQEAQTDLEMGKTLPEFLLVEAATLALAASGQAVDLPDNFLRRAATLPRYTPDANSRERQIEWKNYQEALNSYSSSDPAGPKVAALRKEQIYFFPTSDRAYTITWDYYMHDAKLETNITNKWLEFAPYVLIGLAGMKIAQDMGNARAAKLFQDMYGMHAGSLFKETIERELDDDMVLGANN